MSKFLYYKVNGYELPHSVFIMKGALVKVKRPNASEQQATTARLRLYDPSPAGDLRRNLERQEYFDLQPIPLIELGHDDIVKWIVALEKKEGKKAENRFMVYWAPTRIHNWSDSGFDLELNWQPTGEPARNIPKGDFEDHLNWLTPLLPAIQKVVKTKRHMREASKISTVDKDLIYEENWEWEKIEERVFSGSEHDDDRNCKDGDEDDEDSGKNGNVALVERDDARGPVIQERQRHAPASGDMSGTIVKASAEKRKWDSEGQPASKKSKNNAISYRKQGLSDALNIERFQSPTSSPLSQGDIAKGDNDVAETVADTIDDDTIVADSSSALRKQGDKGSLGTEDDDADGDDNNDDDDDDESGED